MKRDRGLRTTIVFVFMLTLLLVGSRPSYAGWRWLSWLDELSGPGDFRGYTLAAEIWCFPGATTADESELARVESAIQAGAVVMTADQKARALQTLAAARLKFCSSSRHNALTSLVLEAGDWDDFDTNYEGDTDLRVLQLVAYFPIHRIAGEPNRATRAIEVGAGAGAYKLYGTTVRDPDYWRGTFSVRIRVIPSEFFYSNETTNSRYDPVRRSWQALQVRAGVDWILGKLTDAPFNGLTVNRTNELNPSVSLQLDVGAIAWSGIGKWLHTRAMRKTP